jgi:hypothetical protein
VSRIKGARTAVKILPPTPRGIFLGGTQFTIYEIIFTPSTFLEIF